MDTTHFARTGSGKYLPVELPEIIRKPFKHSQPGQKKNAEKSR